MWRAARSRQEGPVDDRVVFQHDALRRAPLHHLLPDAEVADIAADLALGEGPSLVSLDGRRVVDESLRQLRAGIVKTPGERDVACSRSECRAALLRIGHRYDNDRTWKVEISHGRGEATPFESVGSKSDFAVQGKATGSEE
jgi:hypothetical protein